MEVCVLCHDKKQLIAIKWNRSLFRSNNFFHGIWRIPINEIDRPGCFASHMGRSAALLLDVLRETRDHRLLMELALALQPEPEPDKKYLFDSEREQQASLALSLMVQVLRSRLQEIKDSSNVVSSGIEDLKHSSPQQVIFQYVYISYIIVFPHFFLTFFFIGISKLFKKAIVVDGHISCL